uniref:Uncharacterized protein n=1 Tax=Arundo donax TaxID=35708 RepID=A0A0A9EKF5_ARUDO
MTVMLITNMMVKMGSSVYSTAILDRSLHRGSLPFPINVSKNLPEKSGMERVQVVQARSAASETAMRALCCESRAQTPAQVTASEEEEIAAATSAAAAAASREGGA